MRREKRTFYFVCCAKEEGDCSAVIYGIVLICPRKKSGARQASSEDKFSRKETTQKRWKLLNFWYNYCQGEWTCSQYFSDEFMKCFLFLFLIWFIPWCRQMQSHNQNFYLRLITYINGGGGEDSYLTNPSFTRPPWPSGGTFFPDPLGWSYIRALAFHLEPWIFSLRRCLPLQKKCHSSSILECPRFGFLLFW